MSNRKKVYISQNGGIFVNPEDPWGQQFQQQQFPQPENPWQPQWSNCQQHPQQQFKQQQFPKRRKRNSKTGQLNNLGGSSVESTSNKLATFNKAPGTLPDKPATFNKAPGTLPDEPSTFNKAAGTLPDKPATFNKAPGTLPDKPATFNKASGTLPDEPATCNKAPGTILDETISNQFPLPTIVEITSKNNHLVNDNDIDKNDEEKLMQQSCGTGSKEGIASNREQTSSLLPALQNMAHDMGLDPKNHYTIVESFENETWLVSKLQKCEIFALNCASTSLGRNNEMSAMTICLDDGTCILDVKKLGITPELKAVLENSSIKKLMFDCRSSADCLLHGYGVKVSGIIDMQLMQYVLDNPGRQAAKCLPSFLKAVEAHVSKKEASELYNLKITDYKLWEQRPIKKKLTQYVTKEIGLYFLVYKNFPKEIKDIEELSTKYAESRTGIKEFNSKNPYIKHRFMPLNILTVTKQGDVECVECGIKQHISQYTASQVKQKNQQCIVCIQVTHQNNQNRLKSPKNSCREIESIVLLSENGAPEKKLQEHPRVENCSTDKISAHGETPMCSKRNRTSEKTLYVPPNLRTSPARTGLTPSATQSDWKTKESKYCKAAPKTAHNNPLRFENSEDSIPSQSETSATSAKQSDCRTDQSKQNTSSKNTAVEIPSQSAPKATPCDSSQRRELPVVNKEDQPAEGIKVRHPRLVQGIVFKNNNSNNKKRKSSTSSDRNKRDEKESGEENAQIFLNPIGDGGIGTENCVIIDTLDNEKILIPKLLNAKIFSLKCSSTCLGRDHKISAMTICLEDGSIYVVDIKALETITSELKSILENNDIKKRMFDCRLSADCLLYQYQVKLRGIIDMQLIQYVLDNPERKAAEYLPSFLKMVEKYVSTESNQELYELKPKEYSEWDERPIKQELVQYVTKAISLYPIVNANFPANQQVNDIEKISRNYALSRTKFKKFKRESCYWEHGFMPLNVLAKARGGPHKCVKCGIKLHETEYDPNQFEMGKQECIVCTAVIDENRRKNQQRKSNQGRQPSTYRTAPNKFQRKQHSGKRT